MNDGLSTVTALTVSNFLILDIPTAAEERDFLQEIDLMKCVGFHKNIINMIGESTMMKPSFLVLEYMPHGDLLHYLRNKRTDVCFLQNFMKGFKVSIIS